MDAHEPKSTSPPAVTFWGAAQAVSGSMHQLDSAAGSVLLDCGLVQSRRGEADRRNSSFPFHPSRLAAVLLSHAHIDHCGNLPTLVRRGFHGPIYCTEMTAELVAVMLADSAKIQEEESAHTNIARRYAEPMVQPLYTGPDAARTTGLLRPVPYERWFDVCPGVSARFVDAGHLPGSAMTAIRVEHAGRTYSLTYTGDLGRRTTGVLPPPAAVPPAKVIMSECTYGGRRHPDPKDTREQLASAIARTAGRNGKVIVPAFGLGRTQIVVHTISQAMHEGLAPKIPVFVDSPLATSIAKVFSRHPSAFREDLSADDVHYVSTFEESLALVDRPGPCVIVASGGMCEGGRVVQHLAKNIDDPGTTIVLVSYQASGTLGRRIVERQPRVHFLGKDFPLWADVLHLQGFSGHADHDDLMAHLAPLVDDQPAIQLVHGELHAAQGLAAELDKLNFQSVSIPAAGDRVELKPEL